MGNYVLRMPPGASLSEAELMQRLMKWQGMTVSWPGNSDTDIWVLGKTRGNPIPVVLDGEGKDAKTLAIGFWGLVDYLKQEA